MGLKTGSLEIRVQKSQLHRQEGAEYRRHTAEMGQSVQLLIIMRSLLSVETGG